MRKWQRLHCLHFWESINKVVRTCHFIYSIKAIRTRNAFRVESMIPGKENLTIEGLPVEKNWVSQNIAHKQCRGRFRPPTMAWEAWLLDSQFPLCTAVQHLIEVSPILLLCSLCGTYTPLWDLWVVEVRGIWRDKTWGQLNFCFIFTVCF